jgi:uncharacterized protein YecE (DUF72 family)
MDLTQRIRLGCSGWQYRHWAASASRVALRPDPSSAAWPVRVSGPASAGQPPFYPPGSTGKIVVGPFIYVRFHHGTSKYGGRYPDDRLDEWADWLAERAASGLDVFAYFNNDTGGHAPRDAVRLRDRLHVRLAAARSLRHAAGDE